MNNNFYVILESTILTDRKLTNTEKILYALISSYSNNKKGYCYLTYKQIASILGLEKRQFYRCVNNLLKYDYIRQLKQIKNNRTYLSPTINLLLKFKNDNPDRFKALFSYDWLDEEE